MDKQHSDHIEQRIRQAAENFTPPYKEEGWDKMEVLLDKEFNRKRRRGFIWWWYGLFVCLIIGGVYFYFNTGSETNQKHDIGQNSRLINDKTIKENSKSIQARDPEKAAISKGTDSKASVPETTNPSAGLTIPPTQNHEQNAPKTFSASLSKNIIPENKKFATKANGGLSLSTQELPVKDKATKGKGSSKIYNNINASTDLATTDDHADRQAGKIMSTNKSRETDKPEILTTGKANQDTPLKNTSTPAIQQHAGIPADTTESKDHTIAKSDSGSTDKTRSNKIIKLNPTNNIAQPGFYFTASMAADASTVQKFTLNERRPVYGFGIGYRFSNRVSVQTGFYDGRKIYSAGPTDYKANPDSYIGRMKIIKIDADCIIYELPLSLRYDVIAHKNFRAYATAGLSSFIMKRENYKYHLTGSMGYVMKDSTYSSNKNFFSSTALSIGFEQKLFDSFYIQAEPYIRVPISGVGEGKVKLYSAGLQFGIKYQPDRKKKKHP